MMTDTIADMLTRIRNASQRMHRKVVIPASKMKTNIAKILEEEGYIESFTCKGEGVKTIIIYLKYKNKTKVISGLKRISKPGLRVYAKQKDIPRVLNGLGTAIISTPNGLMTDKHARSQNLGGEVLAYVW